MTKAESGTLWSQDRPAVHSGMGRRGFIALSLGLLPACSKKESLVLLQGKVFGTIWTLKLPRATGKIRELVQGRLDEWEEMFSLWREDSVLMKWNNSGSTEWQAVPREVAELAGIALGLAGKTGGAFNPTLAPELRRAGFLPQAKGLSQGQGRLGKENDKRDGVAGEKEEEERTIPPAERWRMIGARLDPPALRKAHPSVQLDLNAVAEGFALDGLTALLEKEGHSAFLLEIGGEFSARGLWQGRPWPVAVESPLSPLYTVPPAQGRDVPGGGSSTPAAAVAPMAPVATVLLRDEALSTSGVYRQHRGSGATWETHARDGRTGAAVGDKLLAVSVRHKKAVLADGWATALLAAGMEGGAALALARENGLAAVFSLGKGEGSGELTVVRVGGF